MTKQTTRLALALIPVLAVGCQRAASQSSPPPAPQVVVGTPLVKPIVEWDEYVGRLDAVEFVEVRARVGGYLRSIHFDEGQLVKEDDLLFVIDPRPFEAEVRSATADIAEAKARVAESTAQLTRAEAQKKASLALLELEQARLRRTKSLLERNAVSREDLDIRESEFAQAQADLDARDAEIESAKAARFTAEAAVETAKSRLAVAQLNLDYTEIRAPVTGRVSRRVVTEGNLVVGGSAAQATLLTTIVSLDPIHVYFDADERAFLKYTRLAQNGKRKSSRDAKNPVYVALADEEDSFPHPGHMDFVDNRLDPNTGTMRGRAILANADLTLTPGLFVRLRLPGSQRYDAVLIPDLAIGTDQSEKFVFVVENDQTVARRVIATGPVVDGLRVVRSGLDGSEKVVLRGLQRVRPGVKVAAREEAIEVRGDDGLPDDYEPVPEEKWLTASRGRERANGRQRGAADSASSPTDKAPAPADVDSSLPNPHDR
jgi:RND family efflux transporter MFP subunit